ncbi:MAG TPA: DUF4393 domain-containing protein [Casimicrobiaceae bacterium]|nr:DUF4393 domain-containing protein [Casimicrobiaceae bacterium]
MFPILREAAQVPGLLKEIYGDLAKPGVAQVGKALSTVLGLGNTVLLPLALLNERAKIVLEKNLESYRVQLDSVPSEKIQLVPPEVGVPVVEKLAYVTDEELSRLYINLLAKASTVDTANAAHPSFVNVIANLSPDEAVLLKEISALGSVPCVRAQLNSKKNPLTYKSVGDLLTGLERVVGLSFQQNLRAYFSNFEGLGLIQINRVEYIANPGAYEELKAFYRPQAESLTFDREEYETGFHNMRIDVTPYGLLFMDACLKNLAGE